MGKKKARRRFLWQTCHEDTHHRGTAHPDPSSHADGRWQCADPSLAARPVWKELLVRVIEDPFTDPCVSRAETQVGQLGTTLLNPFLWSICAHPSGDGAAFPSRGGPGSSSRALSWTLNRCLNSVDPLVLVPPLRREEMRDRVLQEIAPFQVPRQLLRFHPRVVTRSRSRSLCKKPEHVHTSTLELDAPLSRSWSSSLGPGLLT
jgi:hypothetical protein